MRPPGHPASVAHRRPTSSLSTIRAMVRSDFPAAADLPRPIRRVPPLAPVPFVRIHAGLELAAQQRLESRPCERNLLRAQEAIADQEPVRVELLNLSRGELHHLDSSPRGRVLDPPAQILSRSRTQVAILRMRADVRERNGKLPKAAQEGAGRPDAHVRY